MVFPCLNLNSWFVWSMGHFQQFPIKLLIPKVYIHLHGSIFLYPDNYDIIYKHQWIVLFLKSTWIHMECLDVYVKPTHLINNPIKAAFFESVNLQIDSWQRRKLIISSKYRKFLKQYPVYMYILYNKPTFTPLWIWSESIFHEFSIFPIFGWLICVSIWTK